MISRLAVDNAAEFFHKSFLHDSDQLKSASMAFISKNFGAVKATDGWKDLKKNPKSSDAIEQILDFVTKNWNKNIRRNKI